MQNGRKEFGAHSTAPLRVLEDAAVWAPNGLWRRISKGKACIEDQPTLDGLLRHFWIAELLDKKVEDVSLTADP